LQRNCSHGYIKREHMIKEDIVPLLQKSELFKDSDAGEIENLLPCLHYTCKCFDKGEIIASLGEKQEGIGIVLNGKTSVAKESFSGARLIMAVLGEGELFGEITAFAGTDTWPATVSAREDCQIMFIPKEVFFNRCEKECTWHKNLTGSMMKILSRKAMHLNQKVMYLSMKGMRQKISTFLLERHAASGKPIFTLPVNREEMADFLGVSRPSMSREMGRMRDEGLIEFFRNTVKILDKERLATYTD
jgi:CRP/FNR family transcriptional regulator, dissimilatory nitrate respiration regulator